MKLKHSIPRMSNNDTIKNQATHNRNHKLASYKYIKFILHLLLFMAILYHSPLIRHGCIQSTIHTLHTLDTPLARDASKFALSEPISSHSSCSMSMASIRSPTQPSGDTCRQRHSLPSARYTMAEICIMTGQIYQRMMDCIAIG
jgi:hypothetical protein